MGKSGKTGAGNPLIHSQDSGQRFPHFWGRDGYSVDNSGGDPGAGASASCFILTHPLIADMRDINFEMKTHFCVSSEFKIIDVQHRDMTTQVCVPVIVHFLIINIHHTEVHQKPPTLAY